MKKIVLSMASFLLVSMNPVLAQLTAWPYKSVVTVQETSGTAKTMYIVPVEVNTKSIIDSGKMRSDGNDIRLALDCQGNNLLPIWIEKGLNTPNTQIWVNLPTLPANTKLSLFLFYGNSAAPSVSDFNSVFKSKLIITQDTTIATENLNADWIQINSGATLRPAPGHSGLLTLNARKVWVRGNIDFSNAGFRGGIGSAGEGPGGGKPSQNSIQSPNLGGGGGAGYGAPGGRGGYCCNNTGYIGPGGNQYSNATDQVVEKGSGGGAASASTTHNPGGNGGGAIMINAHDLEIAGSIKVNGQTPAQTESQFTSGGGGGSGGGFMFRGSRIYINGALESKGGNGIYGSCGGGGGAGGRIKLFYDKTYQATGTIKLDGGTGAASGRSDAIPGLPGGVGTLHRDSNYKSAEARVTFQGEFPPALELKGSESFICPAQNVVFRAKPGGLQNYEFFLNGASVQSGPADTFAYSQYKTGDSLKVLITHGACVFTGSSLYIRVDSPIYKAESKFSATLDTGVWSFTNQSTGAIWYRWSFGDGNFSTDTNPTHSYPDTMEYRVCLYAEDTCYVDSFCTTLKWHPDTTSGIVREPDIRSLFPNPATGWFILRGPYALNPAEIRVLDIQGRAVPIHVHREPEGLKVMMESALPGIHMLQIWNSGGMHCQKFMVNP